MLHVIGDSHSRIWSGKTFNEFDGNSLFTQIKIHHIGAPLAYNLISEDGIGKWGKAVIEIIEKEKPSAVCLSFGEIDIRNQICKRRANIGLRASTELVAKRVLEFCYFLKGYNIPIFISGVVASGPNAENHVGEPITRNRASIYFDTYIKLYAREGVYLISIVNYLINTKLETKTQFYCDNVHLNLDGFQILKNEFSKVCLDNNLKNYFE
jgi:hypothetical protein